MNPQLAQKNRPLSAIARDIRKAWVTSSGAPNVHYSAAPYLDAMSTLSSIKESYYDDSGLSLKAELKSLVRYTGYSI